MKMKIGQSLIIGFGMLVVIGISLNFDYYQNNLTLVDTTMEHLENIFSSTETATIKTDLGAIDHNLSQITEKLPATTDINGQVISRNPVWFYGTESTNFLRMQSDVNSMIASVDKISAVPKDSSAYHTGMLDIHARAHMIKENLLDAKNFMYASAANIFFTLIWIGGVAGIMKLWIKNGK